MGGPELLGVTSLRVWIGTIRAWKDQRRSQCAISAKPSGYLSLTYFEPKCPFGLSAANWDDMHPCVSREIRLNTNPTSGLYEPYCAHQQARQRRKRPKTTKNVDNPVLFGLVQQWLSKHWSPEQISGTLKKMYPDDDSMHLCSETIYQAIYVHAKGTLKLDLKQA